MSRGVGRSVRLTFHLEVRGPEARFWEARPEYARFVQSWKDAASRKSGSGKWRLPLDVRLIREVSTKAGKCIID
jgi:hypothetical protein